MPYLSAHNVNITLNSEVGVDLIIIKDQYVNNLDFVHRYTNTFAI